MATSYKTPGVYIEEIPKLPPSVAQVETAIPAFIGYTEKAVKNGESIINTPTKINSMVEYVQYFGGPRIPEAIDVITDENNNYAVLGVSLDPGNQFFMYDSLRLFYDNGGGNCYIVSVGLYEQADGTNNEVDAGDENDPVNSPGLRVGLKELEKFDEPTILLFPDAALLPDDDDGKAAFYSLQQMAIAQSAKLQDRVALLDLREAQTDSLSEAVSEFRDNIGMNNLKYAAAYAPWLYSAYTKEVSYGQFASTVFESDTTTAVDLKTLTTESTLNDLVKATEAAIADKEDVTLNFSAIQDAASDGTVSSPAGNLEAPSIRDRYKQFADALRDSTGDAGVTTAFNNLLNFVRSSALKLQSWDTDFTSPNLTTDVKSYAGSPALWRGGVVDLIKIERNDDARLVSEVAARNDASIIAAYATLNATWLGTAVASVVNDADGDGTEDAGKDYDDAGAITDEKIIALKIEKDIKAAFEKIALFADTIQNSANGYLKNAQDTLYEKHPIIASIVKNIKKQLGIIPPSGAVAGIYARVDAARGVWKAPANESINSISGPIDKITAEEQSDLNVDPVAGKSINAIRSFTGKGTLVWGARTLAGNDNEWRYISVRRFFNMVEESSKKSTEVFVFEPNDANTWVKIQGMLENFLTVLWRQGALQGAKPEHAFYVAVGLGKTMTSLDILEGRLIVEIGLAAVRPAEFIILRFSHKLAES
jgi:phage tail sheath protein FI